MTKKDYVKFASALRGEKPGMHWDANKHVQWDLDVRAVTRVLRDDNPNFDEARFLAACGWEKIA